MSLVEHIRNGMKNIHAKFNMHRGADMNLSLFSFSKFCTLEEHELRRFDYMKDVVLHEGFHKKINS
jgi:hypothetical protein